MPATPPVPPPSLSIVDAWDEASRFVRAEAGLLMPIAFATTGVGALLWDIAAPAAPAGMVPPPGPWMLVLVPIGLLFFIGNIAIASLVLNPGISVREVLVAAARRMGNAVSILLLFMAGALGLAVAVSAVAMIVGMLGGMPPQRAGLLGQALLVPVMLFFAIRMLTLWPTVAAAPSAPSPVRTVKAAYRGTRGQFGKLAGVTLLYAVVYFLILGALQFGVGSVLLLLGRMSGQVAAAGVVLAVLTAMAGAVVQAIWGVFAAVVYRRTGGRSNGI